MASKASKSPTGEDREQQDPFQRKNEEQGKQAQAATPKSTNTSTAPKHETNANRGYDEDQPHNPIRSTGSLSKSQESLPTGEPDPGE